MAKPEIVSRVGRTDAPRLALGGWRSILLSNLSGCLLLCLLRLRRRGQGYWFFGRPTLEDLRRDLRAVTKKCRPDWDITTPELKAAWQQGRKDLFYPYGKTYAQTIGEQD